MSVAQKFLFDVSFDGPAEARPRTPVTPAEPSFSRADLAAAEAQARAEGHAAGRDEAVSAHEHRLAASLEAIGERLATLLSDRAAAQREAERMAVELARAMVGKLFPDLARRNSLSEIAALTMQCVREAIDEPRLVLRVADALFDAAQQSIAPLAAGTGYPGKLVILADPALGDGDCRVEWADGGAERDTARTWQEIDAIIARAAAPRDPETPQPHPETDQREAPGENDGRDG